MGLIILHVGLSPAHGTRGVSVKPRGHALLAEDVFAVQHRGLALVPDKTEYK